jgi:predicted nucleotidyltransferase
MALFKENFLADDVVLAEIVQRLADKFHPERIYLFGSKARGDSGPDSDYDLMMVISSADEPRYRIAQRALNLFWELGTAIDILVWTVESFESRLGLVSSLPATIVREGKLLYAA